MSKILESGFESVVLTLLGQMGFSWHGGDAFDPDALPKLLSGEVNAGKAVVHE